MTQPVNERGIKAYKIFVDDLEIYSGSFEEVPEHLRANIIEAFDQWGAVLTGRNLNEMVYSLLFWYEEKDFQCVECGEVFEDRGNECRFCGGELRQFYKYKRDPRLTRVMDCIGMITHAKIE